MSHQEHFFLEYMPAVFTSPESTVMHNSWISLEGKSRWPPLGSQFKLPRWSAACCGFCLATTSHWTILNYQETFLQKSYLLASVAFNCISQSSSASCQSSDQVSWQNKTEIQLEMSLTVFFCQLPKLRIGLLAEEDCEIQLKMSHSLLQPIAKHRELVYSVAPIVLDAGYVFVAAMCSKNWPRNRSEG